MSPRKLVDLPFHVSCEPLTEPLSRNITFLVSAIMSHPSSHTKVPSHCRVGRIIAQAFPRFSLSLPRILDGLASPPAPISYAHGLYHTSLDLPTEHYNIPGFP